MAIQKRNIRLESISFIYGQVGPIDQLNPPVMVGIRATYSFDILDDDGEVLHRATRTKEVWDDLTDPQKNQLNTLATRFKTLVGAD